VAAQIGYCGLDRLRQPLSGAEIRGCWEAWPVEAQRGDAAMTIAPARRPDELPHREFVEVGAVAMAAPKIEPEAAASVVDQHAVVPPHADPGWSLWGESDR
jgi:hypothetical protein